MNATTKPPPAPKPTKPRYRFEVEALPWQTPAISRLRSALKVLLRSFGLRCLSVEEITEPKNQEGFPK